jgi:hypothetical protein
MNHTRLWAAATIIAIVIGISFVLSVPHTRDVPEGPVLKSIAKVPSVTLQDIFKKGLHTITGSVEVPNACTTVSAEARIVKDEASSTDSILVAITMPTDEGICLQLPQRVVFQTTISAAADVPITATVNGMAATTSSP